MLIKKGRAGTEYAIRSNVGLGRVEGAWTNCLLIVRQVSKNLANGKDVFRMFTDLEKASDRPLVSYGVRGKLLKAVPSFYMHI